MDMDDGYGHYRRVDAIEGIWQALATPFWHGPSRDATETLAVRETPRRPRKLLRWKGYERGGPSSFWRSTMGQYRTNADGDDEDNEW